MKDISKYIYEYCFDQGFFLAGKGIFAQQLTEIS